MKNTKLMFRPLAGVSKREAGQRFTKVAQLADQVEEKLRSAQAIGDTEKDGILIWKATFAAGGKTMLEIALCEPFSKSAVNEQLQAVSLQGVYSMIGIAKGFIDTDNWLSLEIPNATTEHSPRKIAKAIVSKLLETFHKPR